MDYLNEHDKFAAQWVRNLSAAGHIPETHVDERDIQTVQAADLVGYRQCHFFGGIAGWPLALKLAGWGDQEIWTGSCPCQPFSSAGKGRGTADERHLWPDMFRLISECRPAIVVGEQVASKDALSWLDGVFADLEGQGYACGAVDSCAAGVSAPHIRQRIYWMAHANLDEFREQQSAWQQPEHEQDDGTVRVVNAHGTGPQQGIAAAEAARHRCSTDATGCDVRPGDSLNTRPQGHRRPVNQPVPEGRQGAERHGSTTGAWSDYDLIPCRDGVHRRVESGTFPLAHGIPRDVGSRIPRVAGMARSARSNRVGRLRGYGNAIVPQVAAEFVRSVMDVMGIDAE